MAINDYMHTALRLFWESSEDLAWTTKKINAGLRQRGSSQRLTTTQVATKLHYMGLR